jgi:hypothetical protein
MIFGQATHISGDPPFVKAQKRADGGIEWRTATSASVSISALPQRTDGRRLAKQYRYDQEYLVMSRRPGQEKTFYRAIPAGSPVDAVPRGQPFRMMRRCLVAKCFNGNDGDEEKPRKTSKCA